MSLSNRQPILEVLDRLSIFSPVKICFNGIELYNDYNSKSEIEPYMIAVPKRLKTATDNYDVLVSRFELMIVEHHHSIVYLYGEKVQKDLYKENLKGDLSK